MITGAQLDSPVDIHDLLHTGLLGHPASVALVCAETSRTWRELEDEVENLAGHYLSMGLRPGDRIASLMPNRTELMVHYLACFKAGFVATPLNYRYMAPEMDHALTVSGAAMLVAHVERAQDLAETVGVDRLPLGVIHYGRETPGARDLETLIATPPDRRSERAVKPSDPAIIFFTSGSTDKPKGVTHSHETLGWMFASTAAGFEMTGRDVVLPGSSISHLGSFMWSMSALALGAKVLVARTFDGDEILPMLRAHRPTVLCMLPAALMALIRDHGARGEDFASLRLCRGGGDKVPLELDDTFRELAGIPIDEGYGMTELGTATMNPPSGVIKHGSCGLPLPGFSVSIRDDKGNELGVGADGNLWVLSRSATVGYWQRAEATEDLFAGDRLAGPSLCDIPADPFLRDIPADLFLGDRPAEAAAGCHVDPRCARQPHLRAGGTQRPHQLRAGPALAQSDGLQG
ncbi:MAG: long-chain fatty acid--CoA ligase, partial [Pseudomonadota bacterium]